MADRREFLVRFTMAAGAVSFLRPFHLFAGIDTHQTASSQTNRLIILHTSNLNGQWPALGVNEKLAGLGGLQNIAKKINEIKAESPCVLVIDAGNMVGSRTPTRNDHLFFYQKLRDAGYDAVIPGQTDLAKGADHFLQLAEESRLPCVGHTASSAGNSTALPYSIFIKEKFRIGIIDAGRTALKGAASTPVLGAAAAINSTAQQLKSRGCTLVVCLIQATESRGLRLASLSRNTDVMISSTAKTSLNNTRIVQNKTGEEVILSYAGENGVMMSRIDLTFNENMEKINLASTASFIGVGNVSYAMLAGKYKLHSV